MVTAVEHDAVSGQRFGKVFARLRFACARWTCRVGTQLDVQRTRYGDPASVRQGSYHQPGCGSQVLIPVAELRLHLSGKYVFIDVVEAELLKPFEVIDRLTRLQTLNDISKVNVLGDEGHQSLPLEGGEVSPDDLDQFAELVDIGLIPFVDVVLVHVFEVALSDVGPHNAVHYQNHLAGKHLDPLGPFHSCLGVLQDSLPHNALQGGLH